MPSQSAKSGKPSGRKPSREKRPKLDTGAHIDRIADAMARGAWITGASARAYAKEHGVNLDTVRGWSSTASRIVRAGTNEERAELTASTLAKLEVMAARAQAAGDIKAGVAALNLLSDIAGLKITKVELTGAGGGPVKVEVDHYWSAMPEGVRELRGAIEAGDDEARARFAGYLVSDSTETSQQIQVLEWAIGVLRSIERRETPALPEAS